METNKTNKIDGVRFYAITVQDGIRLVGMCDLLDVVFPQWLEPAEDWEAKLEAEHAAVDGWMKKNNAHLHAYPKYEQDLGRAVEEAKAKGSTIIVMEDLS